MTQSRRSLSRCLVDHKKRRKAQQRRKNKHNLQFKKKIKDIADSKRKGFYKGKLKTSL